MIYTSTPEKLIKKFEKSICINGNVLKLDFEQAKHFAKIVFDELQNAVLDRENLNIETKDDYKRLCAFEFVHQINNKNQLKKLKNIKL